MKYYMLYKMNCIHQDCFQIYQEKTADLTFDYKKTVGAYFHDPIFAKVHPVENENG